MPLNLYNAVAAECNGPILSNIVCVYLLVYERHSVDFIIIIIFFIIVIASDLINVTLAITSEDCSDGEYNQQWKKLRKMVTNLFM